MTHCTSAEINRIDLDERALDPRHFLTNAHGPKKVVPVRNVQNRSSSPGLAKGYLQKKEDSFSF